VKAKYGLMPLRKKDKEGNVIKQWLALALCLALMYTGLPIQPDNLTKRSPHPAVPKVVHSIPLPTDGFMHARVATGKGYLLVYDNPMLTGPAIGRLLEGEITTVEIYTHDVGMVIGSSAELFGGYVRLSMLEEIPDENSFPEGDPYRAVIKADPLTGGPVDVWLNYCLTDDKVGMAMPGEAVIAQNYDCGYSAEITLPSGLSGFVALEHLSYSGPYEGD
jgi:hypothetical protein